MTPVPPLGAGQATGPAHAPAIMLFTPASDPRKLAKARTLGADAVIADLEDSVAPAARPAARQACAELLATPAGPGSGPSLWVRVNDLAGPDWPDDLLAIVGPGLGGIVVPKVESADQLKVLDGALAVLERGRGISQGRTGVIATIETADGLSQAAAIAASIPRLRCLGFGAADFSRQAGIGYPAHAPGAMALVTDARVRLVLASAKAGLAGPHDSSYPRYDDPGGLRAEALFARDLGFSGKHAIHPTQIAPLREVFSVTDAEIAEARRIVAAWEQAQAAGAAVTEADGSLIDPPIARRAQQVLARASQEVPGADAAR